MRWTLSLIVWILLTSLCLGQSEPGMETMSRRRFVAPEKRWAVIVGVSAYQYFPKDSWLDSATDDAKAVSDFLRSPRGGGIPEENLKLLLNEKATIKEIRSALDFLIRNVRPGDVATIFFAGHGQIQQLGSGEIGYLLLHDSEPDALNATALPMDELERYVDYHLADASQVVLITDACHSGNLLSSGFQASRRRQSVNDHLQGIGQRDGVLNITACRKDEVAVEDPRLGGHGVLTYSLLRALNGAGSSSPQGIVRAQELLEYISRQVPRLTDQAQHPRYGVNYTDEFPLANLNLEGPRYQVPSEPIDVLSANSVSIRFSDRDKASLKVHGLARQGELYLVSSEGEQRTVGRGLSETNVLLTEGLSPGDYTLVQSLGGVEKTWPLRLKPGSQAFDLRTGDFR